MRSPDADAVILGGGLSGLTLARQLAAHGRSSIVLEQRAGYQEDRTWSFWHEGNPPFANAVIGRWQAWSVADGARIAPRTSSQYDYMTLNSAGVYKDLTEPLLENGSRSRLHLGVSVSREPRWDSVRKQWCVESPEGCICAPYVFDSRPWRHSTTGYGQHFLGVELKTGRACFDHTAVQLMHFRPSPADGAVDFLYLLPFSPDHALVEVTRFSEQAPSEEEMAAWLETEINQLTRGGQISRLRTERGFIPMQTAARNTTLDRPEREGQDRHIPGYCRIGLSGGGARPGTGYAFLRIQRMARELATQVRDGNSNPKVALDSQVTNWMDHIFLSVMRRHAQKAPGLFYSLFTNVPEDRLERFLSDCPRHQDRLAVMSALPKTPFLIEALRNGCRIA